MINGEKFSEYLKDPLRVTRTEFWHQIDYQKQRAAMNVLGNNCSSTQDQHNLALLWILCIDVYKGVRHIQDDFTATIWQKKSAEKRGIF